MLPEVGCSFACTRLRFSVLPDDAYIAVDDFKTVKELADHLKYLMRHPSEYLKLFNWRRRWALAPWNGEGYEIGEGIVVLYCIIYPHI